jgi:hypothetical protein
MQRSAPVQLVVRSAASLDPDIEAVWRQMQTERLTGMTAFATHLHAGGYLRDGTSLEDARDVLWTYNSVEVYDLLVLERRWSVDRYQQFVGNALIAALVA